ncbi:MAG: FeoC-like transcriptional regulator [Zoogloeaceae bacterium]|nr:FeoC-like transcriptional regulator [Zoogloeaceae bacterium]
MTPGELRAVLREHGEVSLTGLAARFAADPGLVEDQLRFWLQKGKVEMVVAQCGKSCCAYGQVTLYRWREKEENGKKIVSFLSANVKPTDSLDFSP